MAKSSTGRLSVNSIMIWSAAMTKRSTLFLKDVERQWIKQDIQRKVH